MTHKKVILTKDKCYTTKPTMKTVKVSDLPVCKDRYKSVHIGDGVWRIIDTRSRSKDDQLCVADSEYKADLISASLNHYENNVLNK